MKPSVHDFVVGAFVSVGLLLTSSLYSQETPPPPSDSEPAPVALHPIVSPFGDHVVPAGTTRSDKVVSIFGTTTVDGALHEKAVSLFGDTIINGSLSGEAVAVFGNLEINGPVADKAVVLLGDAKLGEKAVIDGDVVVVFGRMDQHPNAVVRGRVNQAFSFGSFSHLESIRTWTKECLRYGRMLWFSKSLTWIWIVSGLHLFLYALLALVFRGAVVKCAETFEQHPGHSIFAALSGLVLAPLLIVLLTVTGIGALVIPFLLATLFFAGVFGRVAMHAWVGRLVTRHLGKKLEGQAALSVLIGGLIISLLYCVPILGLCSFGLFGLIGFGVVCYTLLLTMNGELKGGDLVAIPSAGSAPSAAIFSNGASAAVNNGALSQHGSPSPAAALGSLMIKQAEPMKTPPAPDYTRPRAGFVRRMCALGIDVLLCGILCMLLGSLLRAVPYLHLDLGVGLSGFFVLLAIYSSLMWRLRAATIGDLVLNLKIVRLDEEPLDWATAIIRALSCFLSLSFVGLGFFWILIDLRSQAWHDKIAGTIVVRMP